MSEKKTQNKSWYKGVKAEFKKIIWPSRVAVAKQTVAVVSISVVLGAIISIVDFIAQYGVDLLIR